MTDKFLDTVYTAQTPDQTRTLYDAWSKSYDSEVTENGYVTPARVADALSRVMDDRAAPVLDFGCGTGLGGQALQAAGFTTLDGMDVSSEMLAQAHARGLYRTLTQIPLDSPAPITGSDYAAITAIGVIGAGAAPLSVLDHLLSVVPSQGRIAFSFNDHTLEDPDYAAAVRTACDSGAFTVEVEEHGPHLPGRGLGATVYVLRKA